MANILNVTSPVASHNDLSTKSGNTTNANSDLSIKNPIDINNVVRADQKQEPKNQTGDEAKLSPNSNLAAFLKGIRESSDVSTLITKLYFMDTAQLVESGINEDFAVELSRFLEMTKIEPEELQQFLKEQVESNTAFSGKFFDAIRDSLYESRQVEQRGAILEFAKSLDNMQSGKHLLANMKTNLQDISQSMFKTDREQLESFINKMDFNAENGDIKNNINVLKREILPFLKSYIGKTGDMGSIRSNISLLTYNTARYENGDLDKIEQSFKRLLGNEQVRHQFIKHFNIKDPMIFEKMTGDQLRQFIQVYSQRDDSDRIREWTNSFLNITERALKGKVDSDTKQVFENIVNSILINHSVYMPLVHIMLPLEMLDKKFYSELWIDPDAEGDGSTDEGRKTRMLIKFDIQDLGFFDLVISYSEKNVDLNLFYPEKLKSLEGEFKRGILRILHKHDISYGTVSLDKNVEPLSISEVFPKIAERRQMVDVRI